ncbi:hypothetical protein PPL_00558 [Heterostelium album PN500]|uniref:A-kinase anchor protein 7-like phosphoesterase domain-containing protein n=1 Tax=Heterostelium pallidum (strain ATCC 26659 / Pp 5 / PN500) TaxID=670386 RepID=D3AWT0_HETP5|nr:hypothetical protein PPL_00558 [Heterostelium album PN500]EFA86753.1 hypothetical protein PPL_00558 [Heterostelium album PN500]|eukprot:XP_020438857.1 hypothetical protein PPL_00558 [Heterostelium album PN500]
MVKIFGSSNKKTIFFIFIVLMIAFVINNIGINQLSEKSKEEKEEDMSRGGFNNNNNNNNYRPNYFLGLQITEPTITDQLSQAQKHIANTVPLIRRDVTAAEKFHLTVFVMTLTDVQVQLPLVKSLLQQAKLISNEIFGENTPSSTIKGIGSFNDRVLWSGLKDDENSARLTEFQSRLVKLFEENNINIDKRWNPHITLAKGRGGQHFVDAFNDTEFGLQKFQSLQLLRIGSSDPITKYYKIEESYAL